MDDITKIALLEQCTTNMQKQLDSIEQKLDRIIIDMENKYVSKTEFSTVKNIVYGMVGVILLAFIGGLISLVFVK